MNEPTWSPVPVVFGTIGDVKSYCKQYITTILYKNKFGNPISENKFLAADGISLSDEGFASMCKDVVDEKSSLLLLKLARGITLSKVDLTYLCNAVPAYMNDDILLQIRPNYPLEYAQSEKVSYKPPVGNYVNKSLMGVNYKSKPSEDRIRHFRLEEILHLYNIKEMLGEANDHRYTELELMGIIVWLYLASPEKYYIDIFVRLLRLAEHGLHLRALLKPYSVSIKRWPAYWLDHLKSTEPYTEVETILGFIIAETITEDMLSDLDSALDMTYMNYYTDENQFLKDIDDIIHEWVNVKTRPPKDVTLDQFFLSWDLWTTSGAASDVRVTLDASDILDGKVNKKYRVHKSALPLYLTISELYEGRLQPSRVSIKAETGKARLVFSAPTYDSLSVSYLLYKYDTHVQNSNKDDFFSFSQEAMLNTSADIIDKLKSNTYMGSSDVEKNDWIQDVVFDCYVFVTLISSVIKDEDIPVLLDSCSRSILNWVFVPNMNYNSRHSRFSNQKGTHLTSTSGLITGQRRTTLYNGFCNRIGNTLAQKMVKRTLNKSPGNYNTFGGDDSIQIFNSHTMGALTYIAATSIFLQISPLKSYISKSTAEYFRVGYTKDRRQGYSNRIIHSIVTSNPTSLQEIDVVLKCKSMYDTLQIYYRRARTDRINDIFKLFYERLGINEDIVRVPTSAGGCGVGLPSTARLVPGIPRYKYNYSYKYKSDWFKNMESYLNPEGLLGVIDSYLLDMSKGVIDRDRTKEARERYKQAVDFWKGKVKFKDNSQDWKEAVKRFDEHNMIERVTYVTGFSRSMSTYLREATNAWQTYINDFVDQKMPVRIPDKSKTRIVSDVINRAEMKRVSDKINFLKENNLVEFSSNIINRLPGKVLLDLILDSINGNSIKTSVPTDMHFCYSIIQPYQLDSKLNYVAQSILSTFSQLLIFESVNLYYNQLLGW